MPPEQKPLLVKSSGSRFAVIGPGDPYPITMLVSDECFSELVGYFSLNKLGLKKLLDAGKDASSFDAVSLFGPLKNRPGIMSSIDVWDTADISVKSAPRGPNEGDDREKMYSLVIESPIFRADDSQIDPEIIDNVKERIKEVVRAFDKKDVEHIRFNGEMISTILALISSKIEKRRAKYRFAIQATIVIFICYVALTVVYSLR